MVAVAGRHPKLNLLNLEAVAVALSDGAHVLLAERAAAGILPSVLDASHPPARQHAWPGFTALVDDDYALARAATKDLRRIDFLCFGRRHYEGSGVVARAI